MGVRETFLIPDTRNDLSKLGRLMSRIVCKKYKILIMSFPRLATSLLSILSCNGTASGVPPSVRAQLQQVDQIQAAVNQNREGSPPAAAPRSVGELPCDPNGQRGCLQPVPPLGTEGWANESRNHDVSSSAGGAMA